MGDEAAPKLDPSPFYLGSGDQPGNLITHVILKSDNYVAWSRAMTLSLKARWKFVFVDSTIRKPTVAAKLLDWDTVNSMTVSWILCSMDLMVAMSIPFHDEARTMWVYLENRFSVANGPHLQRLRTSITECKQSKSMMVYEYYTMLMSLYDELNRLKPLHACTCGLCTCDVAGKFAADREEEKLHQFMIGIDDDVYVMVRSNLVSHTPLPDLNRAHQAFLQEENSPSRLTEPRDVLNGQIV
ncbi:unnamed protein product [Cuscuta europaea]|uniref:Retrotransposon Copia-like N-terminal domain-containing protein n=1 Tax=Cuscuta europaea TaxID=41803 RepID=A0A9P0ZWY3_CUSEU|nr:unnamed protein product [Cuscuta europaea]